MQGWDIRAIILDRAVIAELNRPDDVQSAGHTLSAVLAELDGTGIPLAYMFARPIADRPPNQSVPLIQHFALFLGNVRTSGCRPSFFACDKDSAEIAAVKVVFPTAQVQFVTGMSFERFEVS